MRKTFVQFSLMTLLGMSVLSGCAASPPPEVKQEAPPPMDLLISQIDQVTKIDKKLADGQFVIIQANFMDKTTKPIILSKDDIVLETATDDQANYYTQPLETGLSFAFGTDYGKDLQDRVLGTAGLTIYPKIETLRYLIFMLPAEADLSQYNLLVKLKGEPPSIKVPLVSASTSINDRRHEQQ